MLDARRLASLCFTDRHGTAAKQSHPATLSHAASFLALHDFATTLP
jgi:hypothetical protein